MWSSSYRDFENAEREGDVDASKSSAVAESNVFEVEAGPENGHNSDRLSWKNFTFNSYRRILSTPPLACLLTEEAAPQLMHESVR